MSLGDFRGQRFPVVLEQTTSLFGFGPVTLRFESLTSDGIGLFAAEEKSQASEIEHIDAETISILLADLGLVETPLLQPAKPMAQAENP